MSTWKELTAMTKLRAAIIRGAYTTVQALIPILTATTLTGTDLRIGLVGGIGAGVLCFLSCLIRDLPEVQPVDDGSVSPEIEGEEIIDTLEDDEKLNGGGINE